MFGDLAGFRAYHVARGNGAPTNASDPDATAALVRAWDYVTAHYVTRLAAAYDETLPELETAAYIAAGQELSTPGFFAKTYTADDRKVLTRLDAIAWTPVDGGDTVDGMVPRSTLIEALLRPYMTASGVTGFMVV